MSSIEFNHQSYHVLYASSSVSKVGKLLSKLSNKYPALVIPYLYLVDKISASDLENFEQYLYYPYNIQPPVKNLVRSLSRICNAVDLGVVDRDSLVGMYNFESLRGGIKKGSTARVLVGPWKNLLVKVDSINNNEASCSYRVLNEIKIINTPTSSLKEVEAVPNTSLDSFISFEKNSIADRSAKVIIVDGYNSFFHHLYGYDNMYRSRDSMMIGGAFWLLLCDIENQEVVSRSNYPLGLGWSSSVQI